MTAYLRHVRETERKREYKRKIAMAKLSHSQDFPVSLAASGVSPSVASRGPSPGFSPKPTTTFKARPSVDVVTCAPPLGFVPLLGRGGCSQGCDLHWEEG